MDAMILAAGRGERMRPLSDRTPKPLLMAGGKRLIEHQLLALARAGVKGVVVNCAHLGGQIEEALGGGARYGLRIRYSHEAGGALGTGGGVARALPLLRGDFFLVVNGDVWCDFALGELRIGEGLDACIVLVKNPPHNPRGDFALDNGAVRLLDAGEGEGLTFSGIGVYARRLFTDAPGEKFSLGEVLRRAVAGGRVGGVLHRGRWMDVGTPARLAALGALLDGA
ncbi:MAG: nucleotidyltransferase family protein [Gammaproteobacteria bacterium]|nr:nucleotidyltransferase family protein [Gammaproteobacteria bacterium]MDD9871560.1 nucleotidyltransferase family protein [Gammaproteobacteria bacterium]